MTGLTTWQDVASIDGNVLLIVNSPDGDEAAVGLVLETLEQRVPPARLHIIATAAWTPWLAARNWPGDRLLVGADAAGRHVELNYFLESADALRWIAAGRFAAVIGSAPHNLYNEEIKDTFEHRIGIVMGTARFLTHTLPAPYLFSFALSDLLQRFNRGSKLAKYGAICRAIVEDAHRVWCESGKAAVTDGSSFDDVAGVLERHLGAAAASWDEASPIPLDRPDVGEAAARFLSYLGGTLTAIVSAQQAEIARLQEETGRRDRLLSDLHEELAREVGVRDRRLVEQHDGLAREVQIRDGRLADLQAELVKQVQVRDERLAELHAELAREVEVRDQRLVELNDELVKQVAIRDRNLVEMDQDRRESVAVRDKIIADLQGEMETLRRGSKRG